MKEIKKKENKGFDKIIPLGNRVLVDPEEKAESGEHKKTASGLYVPDSAGEHEKPERGMVLAVGEGAYDDGILIPVKVKVGDKVIFSKYGYDEIKIDDKKYYILKEDSILAVIK
jgi:chaperonin GroES